MARIIIVIIFLIIALGFFIVRPKATRTVPGKRNSFGMRESEDTQVEYSLWWGGFIPLGFAAIVVVFSSFTQVHAKEIGVGVAFGKPVSEYNAGLHFKPFWVSVTKIDGTVFTDSYGTDTKDAKKGIDVRLGDGNPATASSTIRWHVNPAAVDYIYSTYRSNNPTDSLRDAVVETQYKAVVNEVFSGFNPTADSDIQSNFSPNYPEMAKEITAKMLDAVKDSNGTSLIIIDKVTVSGVSYSPDTEKRISGIVQQASKTQQAKQLEETNVALADANSKLSRSLSGSDGVKVLVQQCLQDLADGKFVAPAGFSCWPGGNGGVVIPSSK